MVDGLAAAMFEHPPTSLDAQRLHRFFMETDDDHDIVSCWCCCIDCDFSYQAVAALDALLGIPPGLALRL